MTLSLHGFTCPPAFPQSGICPHVRTRKHPARSVTRCDVMRSELALRGKLRRMLSSQTRPPT
eukprot:2167195-Prorocentrum_lima.AAC.1